MTRVSGTSEELLGVAYGNGRYVAVGSDPNLVKPGTIQTSTDGVSWTTRAAGTNENLLGVAYGNG